MSEPNATTGHDHSDREDEEPFTVRAFAPSDQPALDRLLRDGLLPGHVPYTPQEIEQIKAQRGSTREQFWVAEADGRLIGSIAVVEDDRAVGRIYWLRVAPEYQASYAVAKRLAQTAATHAREVGLLKLVSQVPRNAAERVVSYYHQMGFALSRARDIGGRHVLEFYLDLYATPERE